MVLIQELKVEDEDDGFVTESDTSSDSSKSDRKSEAPNPDEEDSDDEYEKNLLFSDIENETIADRIYALRDIISPATRSNISDRFSSLCRSTSSTAKTLGNVAWVITTSMIMIGLPLALSIEGESMLVAHEKEVERQQNGQQNLIGLPGTSPGSNPLNPTQNKTAVTPTGF
ncbi:mitochondrial outer membrane translocase complex, subunit Tom22 [Phakopsora pachyrhizi]|uniref:Mitochondrial outer membrane translocase complex, subunit Tom22 n=1 Tax=Phakopsora pachyrhizi TaxID=170000 RepID=A0AAV0BS37_PHAPC|nr:mitochondrial outer membrane translocase complex, subunit Tom22 [Phakopsora pachyrhizi]CAH7688413.1 mitochondrial outer membrane translocase complex, subunit Tom22 [Phakopsora pachyrhizi]